MHRYRDLLKITHDIECRLESNLLEGLALLQKQRLETIKQLQSEFFLKQSRELAEIIRDILKAEKRCVTLALDRKNNLVSEMGAVGRARKLQNAYSRQSAMC